MKPEEIEILGRAAVVIVTSPDRHRYGFKEDYEERMLTWEKQNKELLNKVDELVKKYGTREVYFEMWGCYPEE